jgi:hypothetical protein
MSINQVTENQIIRAIHSMSDIRSPKASPEIREIANFLESAMDESNFDGTLKQAITLLSNAGVDIEFEKSR